MSEGGCCADAGCCARFCDYCGEYFRAFLGACQYAKHACKFGNSDFQDTLPGAIVFLTLVQVVALVVLGVLLLVVVTEGTGHLAGFFASIIGIWFILSAIICYLWNYIYYWAAKTGNKNWLIGLPIFQLIHSVDAVFGIWTTVPIITLLAFGVDITLVLPSIIQVTINVWIALLCLAASPHAHGPNAASAGARVVVAGAPAVPAPVVVVGTVVQPTAAAATPAAVVVVKKPLSVPLQTPAATIVAL